MKGVFGRHVFCGLTILVALFLCPLSAVYAAGDAPTSPDKDAAMDAQKLLKSLDESFPSSTQAIIVIADGPDSVAKAMAFEKVFDNWAYALVPMRAMIGRNGFAPKGEKREGDGRTPSGAYALGLAFGYGSTVDLRMPYRQMTSDDIWVDDVNSPDYNKLTRKGRTTAKSFEDMVLTDDRYKYGIVVEYNTNPVVLGNGSAIFIHVWKDETTATSGCVALSEQSLLRLLGWLDPEKKPVIVLGR